MAIPSYDTLMLPVLRYCAEKPWARRDLAARIADDLDLTTEEREQLVPSGQGTTIASRVGWAATYLKQAGLLERPQRGVVAITPRGREVLRGNPEKIDDTFLEKFEEFKAFRHRTRHRGGAERTSGLIAAATDAAGTPEEQISAASSALDESLREALLARLCETSPIFFEKLIIELLLAMGYGGSRTDAGEHLGRTGDGGVDGIVREDQLGLDRVYLQAKRYQPGSTIGSEVVQAFIGALIGRGATKGVLITTSTFSRAARDVAERSGALRLVLIDGDALTKLMVRFNVGVRVAQTVEIKRIDQDYFEVSELE